MSRAPKLLSPQPAKQLEKHVARAVIEYLAWRKWKVERLDVDHSQRADGRWSTIGYEGRPDYVCLHADYPPFYLELKRPGGRLQPNQAKVHWELDLLRLKVAVINSVAGIETWLEDWEKRRIP